MQDALPVPIEDLTADLTEREIIMSEYAGEIAPDDPHFIAYSQTVAELAALQRSNPPRWGETARLRAHGWLTKDIAEKVGITPSTVSSTLGKPQVKRMIFLHLKIRHYRSGPQKEARMQMLWRIALRNEASNPRVSITAIDIMNKQDGVYKTEETQTVAPSIQINQFFLESGGPHLRDVTKARPSIPRHPEDAEDAVFTPIPISVDTD